MAEDANNVLTKCGWEHKKIPPPQGSMSVRSSDQRTSYNILTTCEFTLQPDCTVKPDPGSCVQPVVSENYGDDLRKVVDARDHNQTYIVRCPLNKYNQADPQSCTVITDQEYQNLYVQTCKRTYANMDYCMAPYSESEDMNCERISTAYDFDCAKLVYQPSAQ